MTEPEKWREYYDGWRVRANGQIDEDEYYESYKYYYNSKNQLIRKEYYDLDRLSIVYEYEYDPKE